MLLFFSLFYISWDGCKKLFNEPIVDKLKVLFCRFRFLKGSVKSSSATILIATARPGEWNVFLFFSFEPQWLPLEFCLTNVGIS